MFEFHTIKTVRFYMKSGNVINADKVYVDDVKFTWDSDQIRSVTGWKQKPSAMNLLPIQSIDLKQIEAIVVVS